MLSVVAQQILSILQALANENKRFVFEGQEIRLNKTCGIFITMNPGYAGRTELPDNLKSMFRPISMIVPDSSMISEIILFGEGFSQCKVYTALSVYVYNYFCSYWLVKLTLFINLLYNSYQNKIIMISV